MSDKPGFIDNRDGNTMASALRQLLGADTSDTTVVAEDGAKVDEARIATAYFSPSGFGHIAPAIKDIPSIRLLLGTDPIADSELWQKQVGETETRFITRRLHEQEERDLDNLEARISCIPKTESRGARPSGQRWLPRVEGEARRGPG